ncbi:MAG: class I SAM-dependent methyltransferase [Ornithinimicrobium sp.]
MAAQRMTSWTYAESFVPAPAAVEHASEQDQARGGRPFPASAGSSLRLLAAALEASHVIEVGGGAGVSGLWLLAGMSADGVLTTIEPEPERQRAARAAFAAAGVAPQRTRLIGGDALTVLPRMTDGAYDMVVVAGEHQGDAGYTEEALRLLRRGGALVVNNILGQDRVADPTARDEVTVAIRDLGKSLRDDDRLMCALWPVGDGVLAAIKR